MQISDCEGVTQDLVEFLARSAALKTLSIAFAAGCSSTAFFTILPAVSLLTSFTVDCSHFSANLCTVFFSLLGDVNFICPKLTHLELSDIVPERGFSYVALAVMLRARLEMRPAVTALSACRIVFGGVRHPEHLLPSVVIQLHSLLLSRVDIQISAPGVRWPRHQSTAHTDILP
ncbi:hypothetical protein FB451DRAFT_1549837 [Mycena latifolia]|nr:hypothetical protein FB451DRAFT_1549837 [Mycena latifolia]